MTRDTVMIPLILHTFSKSFPYRLTVSIEASLSDSMKLIDVNGNPHPMTKFQVRMMILTAWLAFLLASLMNILFYKVHPSFVDFDPKRFKERGFIYYFGRKRRESLKRSMSVFVKSLMSVEVVVESGTHISKVKRLFKFIWAWHKCESSLLLNILEYFTIMECFHSNWQVDT